MRSVLALPPIAAAIAAFPADRFARRVEASIDPIVADRIGNIRPEFRWLAPGDQTSETAKAVIETLRRKVLHGVSRKFFKIISKKVLESVKSDALADSPA